MTAAATTPTPPPTSLAEMQSLSGEQLRGVEAYQYQGSTSPRRVIRAIVRHAVEVVEWTGREDANSLRGFWYNPVKPIVERAFPKRRADPEYAFGRLMSQELSKVVSAFVREGELTYRDLNIADDSRQRRIHLASLESDRILFVEKAAAYRKLAPLADVYELSIVSGGGWSATAAIEDITHELAFTPHDAFDLFVVSDYDPTGFRIAEDFRTRAGQLGLDVNRVERVGISPDQLDAKTRNEQRFRPPDDTAYADRWFAEYGLGPGGRYGLEIEAVGDLTSGGSELRRVVVEALRPHIRERDRYKSDMARATSRAAEDAIEDIRNDVTRDLDAALRAAVTEMLDESPAVSVARASGDHIMVALDDDHLDTLVVDDNGGDGDETEKPQAKEQDPRDLSRYLPEPVRMGDLHDRAEASETMAYRTEAAQQAVREELQRQLDVGDINLHDLLG